MLVSEGTSETDGCRSPGAFGGVATSGVGAQHVPRLHRVPSTRRCLLVLDPRAGPRQPHCEALSPLVTWAWVTAGSETGMGLDGPELRSVCGGLEPGAEPSLAGDGGRDRQAGWSWERGPCILQQGPLSRSLSADHGGQLLPSAFPLTWALDTGLTLKS